MCHVVNVQIHLLFFLVATSISAFTRAITKTINATGLIFSISIYLIYEKLHSIYLNIWSHQYNRKEYNKSNKLKKRWATEMHSRTCSVYIFAKLCLNRFFIDAHSHYCATAFSNAKKNLQTTLKFGYSDKSHKNLKKSPKLFWTYKVIGKLIGWFFSNFCCLLRISELY